MHTEGEVDRQAKMPDLPNFHLAVRLFQFEDHIHERIFRGFRSGDHAIFQYTAVVDAHIFEDVGIIVGDVKFQISRLFHGECAGRRAHCAGSSDTSRNGQPIVDGFARGTSV